MKKTTYLLSIWMLALLFPVVLFAQGKRNQLPDLSVTALRLIPTQYGCQPEISIRNLGPAMLSDRAYDLRKGVAILMYMDERPLGKLQLNIADPKRDLVHPNSTVVFVWKDVATRIKPGKHSFRLVCDPDQFLTEANERNNSFSADIECGGGPAFSKLPEKQIFHIPAPPPGPDLIITDFEILTEDLRKENGTFFYSFRLSLRNDGNVLIKDPFYIQIQKLTAGSWGPTARENCYKHILPLPAGTSREISGTIEIADHEVSDQTVSFRARIDAACKMEFPPVDGEIQESNEANNTSETVSLSGTYSPRIDQLDPEVALPGSEARIIGMNYDSPQGDHRIRLLKGTERYSAEVIQWTGGIVRFRVPVTLAPGRYMVSVSNADLSRSYSNGRWLVVAEEKIFTRQMLYDSDETFGLAQNIEINLHTLKGDCGYENRSTATIFGQSDTIDVKVVEKDTKIGEYRWLVNDFNTKKDGVSFMQAKPKAPNEFTVAFEFENGKTELKGCFSPVGKTGFNETGCPDIEINNAILFVTFELRDLGGKLDYSVRSIFSADISPHHGVWETLIDWAYSEWRTRIVTEVQEGVKKGLEKPDTRRQVADSLMAFLQFYTGSITKTVAKVSFEPDGWHLFVY